MAKYKVKGGANIGGLGVEMKQAISVVANIYKKYGYTLCITAGTDGKHMSGSKHYEGNAIDCRIWGLKEAGFFKIIPNDLQEALDDFKSGYQVVIEGDHYHIEWDPKNWKPNRHFNYD